jgi:cyclophilin family peptidyl-prolyl cis-trans isomerase
MIQGGGFTPDLAEKPTEAPIPNEAKNGLKNMRGALAMARLPDAGSARAQFFINLKDKPNLDPGGYDPYGYTVFGKVTDGMDVVDAIGAEPTEARGVHANVPVQSVVIQSIKVKE